MKLELTIAVIAGLLLGLSGSAILEDPAPDPVPLSTEQQTVAQPPAAPEPEGPSPAEEMAAEQEAIQRALDHGVKQADRFEGQAAVAVAASRWSEAVQAGSPGEFRMWSTSKPVAAVALLKAQEAAGQGDQSGSVEVEDALVRSSNCGMRKIVFDLQRITGSKSAAAAAFINVTVMAGVDSDLLASAQFGPLTDGSCDDYLSRLGAETAGDSWRFGTARWTTADAASFALALGAGAFEAPGDTVRSLLERPKEVSPDPGGEDSVLTDLDWGAGKVFPPDWRPAYKSGWGGSANENYLASQIVSLDIDGRAVGVSVMFKPDLQPVNDAVGQGDEDEAIEVVLNRVRAALKEEFEAK